MCFDGETDIVLVTLVDVGEVGHPVARLVGHGPLRRPRGGKGGDVAGGPGGGVGPSGEGNSSATTEVAAE